jgi:hypothetical protein
MLLVVTWAESSFPTSNATVNKKEIFLYMVFFCFKLQRKRIGKYYLANTIKLLLPAVFIPNKGRQKSVTSFTAIRAVFLYPVAYAFQAVEQDKGVAGKSNGLWKGSRFLLCKRKNVQPFSPLFVGRTIFILYHWRQVQTNFI